MENINENYYLEKSKRIIDLIIGFVIGIIQILIITLLMKFKIITFSIMLLHIGFILLIFNAIIISILYKIQRKYIANGIFAVIGLIIFLVIIAYLLWSSFFWNFGN
ncbi:MAG: hypothetical protein V1824_03135 [archaeon]